MSETSDASAEPGLPDRGEPPVRIAPVIGRGAWAARPPAKVIRLRGDGRGKRERKSEAADHDIGVNIEREEIQVSRFRVLWRLVVWTFSFVRLGLGILGDRLRRRASKRSDAVRLRLTLERLGPSAIKIGQQLGVRADLVPKEISEELLGLLDSVAPIPVAQARAVIEKELGQPISSLFSQFEDEPLGSASIAVAYRATLPTGEVVAVKVRRPGVERILAADLDAIEFVFRQAERFGLIERGKARPVLREFRVMLLDELNFRVEARQTSLFRADAKKANRYVTAPRVFGAYSTNRVLVTEFVTGVFLRHVIEAVQRDDQAFLADLAAKGFDLEKIGRRMVNVFYWQLFESSFFHADPHPSNVILQPDNTLVMIDFGATGTITSKYRADLIRFINSFAKDDIDGMVRNMIASLEPLPPLDLEEYTNEMTHAMREFLFTAKSKAATWQERCSGRAMSAMAEISRRYKIPMRSDVLRYFRASFQFDSIVYRLNPHLDSRKEVRRYFSDRAREEQKKRRKRLRAKLSGRGGIDSSGLQSFLSTAKSRIQDLDNVVAVLAPTVRQVTRLFNKRVSKLSQIAFLVVRFVEQLSFLGLCMGVWGYVEQYYPESSLNHLGDEVIHTLFGHELCLYMRRPETMIREKVWFWMFGLAALMIVIFHRWAVILRTPQSKVEE